MLLAIDTSTDYVSLALHDGFQVRLEYSWASPRRHTVSLLPRLAGAFEQLDMGPEHLSGIAVARGPGSFTGLRAGMSVAKGLALTRALPLVGVPTLDIVAAAQPQDARPLCAVLQAGRGRICVSFRRWETGAWRAREEEPRVTTWLALTQEITSPTVFSGEIDSAGAEALATLGTLALLAPAAVRLRRAGYLAELAWQRLSRREVDDPATLAPLYLKYAT